MCQDKTLDICVNVLIAYLRGQNLWLDEYRSQQARNSFNNSLSICENVDMQQKTNNKSLLYSSLHLPSLFDIFNFATDVKTKHRMWKFLWSYKEHEYLMRQELFILWLVVSC